MQDNISQRAENLTRKLGEAQMLLGVAVGLEIESSSLRADAWRRARERYLELSEQAQLIAEECRAKSR